MVFHRPPAAISLLLLACLNLLGSECASLAIFYKIFLSLLSFRQCNQLTEVESAFGICTLRVATQLCFSLQQSFLYSSAFSFGLSLSLYETRLVLSISHVGSREKGLADECGSS
jgi:hypothetical protein